MFSEGVLSNGPAFFIDGYGYSLSFSEMKNGRPANASLYKCYYTEGESIPVNSKTKRTDVSGSLNCISQIDPDLLWQGYGRGFYSNGNVG